MRPTRSSFVTRLLALLGLLTMLAACGQAPPAAAPTAAPAAGSSDATAVPAATGGDDLLAEVKSRGKLLIATDSNYKPQSFKNPDGSWEGFDVDVASEVAKRLGLQAEFLDISFDVITAGSWNGRWDINVGSMTPTPGRKEALIFTSPYYYTPAAFVVHQDSSATAVAELEGKNIGVGAGTTYLSYLNNELALEGEEILTPAPTGTPKVYETDVLALDDLSLGNGTRLDAVVTALPTAEQAIKDGKPLKILGDPVYYEALAVALDRKSAKNSQSLADEISKIIEEMRADGTLTALSMKYYGVDITTKK